MDNAPKSIGAFTLKATKANLEAFEALKPLSAKQIEKLKSVNLDHLIQTYDEFQFVRLYEGDGSGKYTLHERSREEYDDWVNEDPERSPISIKKTYGARGCKVRLSVWKMLRPYREFSLSDIAEAIAEQTGLKLDSETNGVRGTA